MPISDSGVIKIIEKYWFHQVLFSGDQLTAACARSAQMIHANFVDGVDQLERLIPVSEDWHTNLPYGNKNLYHLAIVANSSSLIPVPFKTSSVC